MLGLCSVSLQNTDKISELKRILYLRSIIVLQKLPGTVNLEYKNDLLMGPHPQRVGFYGFIWLIYIQNPSFLPNPLVHAGYAALFRHVDDSLTFCAYILPGNPSITNGDLSYWHHRLLEEDPNISQAVGKNAELERMKAWGLRLGGEPVTYGDHVLVVGDAAGMIDPLTGEGIHHAMDGGRIAARFLCEAIAVGNFDKEVMREYQNRWLKAFGNDYKW